jgi:hypothetical protein
MALTIRAGAGTGLPITWRLHGDGREFHGRWDDDEDAATKVVPAGTYRLDVIGEDPAIPAFFRVSARPD